jgi:hypothetical protein
MTLPDGLEKTITHFLDGCTAYGKTADAKNIREEMEKRLTKDFKDAKSEWPAAESQVLTVARLSGRLASAYADLDNNKTEVKWKHARRGLQDGKEECRQTPRAKHCRTAKFD